MHKPSGAHVGLLFLLNTIIAMENINERLQTIPPKRQEQFHRILANNTRIFSPKTETDKQKIIELTQSKLLKYLANEEKEKLV
jgi:hypothetical protein